MSESKSRRANSSIDSKKLKALQTISLGSHVAALISLSFQYVCAIFLVFATALDRDHPRPRSRLWIQIVFWVLFVVSAFSLVHAALYVRKTSQKEKRKIRSVEWADIVFAALLAVANLVVAILFQLEIVPSTQMSESDNEEALLLLEGCLLVLIGTRIYLRSKVYFVGSSFQQYLYEVLNILFNSSEDNVVELVRTHQHMAARKLSSKYSSRSSNLRGKNSTDSIGISSSSCSVEKFESASAPVKTAAVAETTAKSHKPASFFLIFHQVMWVLLKQRFLLLSLFICVAITSCQVPLTAYFVGQALGRLTTGSSGVSTDSIDAIVGIVGINVVTILMYIAVGFLFGRLSSNGTRELVDIMARKALSLEKTQSEKVQGSASRTTPGQLSSTFSQGLAKMQMIWSLTLWSGLTGVLCLVINFGFIFSAQPVVGLVLLSFVPVIYAPQSLKETASKHSFAYVKEIGVLQAYLQNFLSIRQSAQVFSASDFLINKIWDPPAERAQNTLYLSTLWATLVQTALNSVGYLASTVAISLVIVLASMNKLPLDKAIALFGYISGVVAPVAKLANWNEKLIWSAGAIGDVYDICAGSDEAKHAQAVTEVAGKSTTETREEGLSIKVEMGPAKQDEFEQHPQDSGAEPHFVHAQGLTFTYPGNEKPTLCELEMQIMAGEYTALVGNSGSGKSTLFHLMTNIKMPPLEAGRILVNGVPADEYRKTSMVLQEAEILDGSIIDNIAFGGALETLNDVVEAAKLAELHETILEFPDQYETVIGEQSGVSLSGGQMARLSLARALFRKPELLLLDEVTSPLDPSTETNILKTLRRLHETTNITIFLVTHSVFAMQSVNTVLMLESGRLTEEGSFCQLVEQKGAFYKLVQDQLSDKSPGVNID